MKSALKKIILGVSVILMVEATLLSEKGEAVPSYAEPIAIAYWWENPARTPEKWFSPRKEDDEWYKRRHKQKYRRIK